MLRANRRSSSRSSSNSRLSPPLESTTEGGASRIFVHGTGLRTAKNARDMSSFIRRKQGKENLFDFIRRLLLKNSMKIKVR